MGVAVIILDADVQVDYIPDFLVRFGVQNFDEGTAWGCYIVV